MDFVFEQIRLGGDRNFGYLVGDRSTGVAAAVDPAFSPEEVLARAEAQQLTVELILNTHGHADHTNGNAWLKERTGAPILAYKGANPDIALDDRQEFAIGSVQVRVLYAPGHADDHLLFHLPSKSVALTGDLLFVGKIGGTAGEADARTEYDSLQRALAALPDETTIWPGHDYGCRPSSTIALERVTNPFLLAEDFDAFLALKQNWAAYKASMGLK